MTRTTAWLRRLVAALVPIGLGVALAVSAGPATATPISSIAMPSCCALETVGVGGDVYTLVAVLGGTERFLLVRIDPGTNTITGQLALPPGASTGGGNFDTHTMTVLGGSIWITQYYENEVLRLDPNRMRITARIPVGRSPGSLVTDGSALWVLEETDGTVARIDPASNTVTSRVLVRSHSTTDYPYQLAYDGTQLLVSLPTTGRVARVNPRTLRVAYDAVGSAAECALILPTAGGYWLDDTACSNDYFRWDSSARAITATIAPGVVGDFGAVIVGPVLYAAEYAYDGSAGYVAKYDATTGALLAQVTVGDDAEVPQYAAGALWVGNWTDRTLAHLALF